MSSEAFLKMGKECGLAEKKGKYLLNHLMNAFILAESIKKLAWNDRIDLGHFDGLSAGISFGFWTDVLCPFRRLWKLSQSFRQVASCTGLYLALFSSIGFVAIASSGGFSLASICASAFLILVYNKCFLKNAKTSEFSRPNSYNFVIFDERHWPESSGNICSKLDGTLVVLLRANHEITHEVILQK